MCRNYLLLIAVAISLTNCTTSDLNMSEVNLQNTKLSNFYLDQITDDIQLETSVKITDELLTLYEAVSLTLLHNPSLKVFPFEIRSKEALAMQANLLPNPELELEIEDFAGTGGFEIGNGIEITTFYSQLIERGNKRENRYQLGLWETEISRLEYKIAKMNVLTEMAIRYIDVLSAQENVKLLQELVSIGEEALYAVSERVRAGRVTPLEETRTKVELAMEQNALNRAEQEFLSAKELLHSMWGNKYTFDEVSGSFEVDRVIPDLNNFIKLIENNPEVQQWTIEKKRRQSVLDIENSQSIPDITVGGGVRYYNESEDGTLQFGVSMPIMLFNRNQGGIRAAHELLNKADQEKEAHVNQLRSQLVSQYQKLVGTQQEVKRLKQEILPDSEIAYSAAREGYQQGKFDYLDVIDAQRTLFQVRIGYLESLTLLHHQWINLERLTGAPLKDVIEQNTSRSNTNENE